MAPPLLAETKPSATRQFLAFLLNLALGLFLVDAAVSVLDDSAALCFDLHALLLLRLIIGLFAVLLAILVYLLMGLTPAIPKSIFGPLALFYLASQLIILPLVLIYFHQSQRLAWFASLSQLAFGLGMVFYARHNLKLAWPLMPLERLGSLRFTWRNFFGFFAANIFILLPLVLIYLFLCFAGLVSHFTEGFMTLHPSGFTMQAKKYVRADGKTIQLFPMAHVADGNFYEEISQTFPTNSLILMEGVTDEKKLLHQKINYQKMARSLGLSEQHEKFAPTRGEIVPADIDVSEFSTNTLALLNVIFRIHGGNLDADTIQKMMQLEAPDLPDQLLNDLLRKRNKHLLEQIQLHLPKTEHIVLPWGVAHMPELARELQKVGFHPTETNDYVVIRFHGSGNSTVEKSKPAEKK